MHYGDLIQFEPIESVIQLLDANRPDEGRKLVATYVISDDMAERIAAVLIPQLSFDEAVDHKGVLVVGNYGTGKSHLMSVISLVAEDADWAAQVRHPRVAAAAAAIAGRFKVHRIEIASEMSLREIVTSELQSFLDRHGLDFRFPPANQVVNNKGAFAEMMAAFDQAFPGQGLLLVVDELLDYLRSRRDHELILDLSFMRELGEVCKHLRFRFMAGVQEAVFDSSRFEHVADSLRRVKDRFTQTLLARADVSFVVAERLLKKTADQQHKIRTYLTPFARCYSSMNERMDEYVRLFPVHPDYLSTFERLTFTEKRGALVTIRDQIQAMLGAQIPTDRPGLLGYDRFWDTLKDNSVFRADPVVGEVVRVSEVLAGRVQQAFTRPAYKPMALRLIAALSVHRLTTGGDIYVPLGPTAEELRDTLCLYQPGIEDMGGDPAADLLTIVQTVLREIGKTVNGQFISKAAGTDQYYLDLKKDIDYDAQIEKRADTLDDEALDRAYFSAVRQLMERTDETTYVSGFQIWQYQIEWQERRVERRGYLFFGAPNDRPTAQPPRDFYIYFIQPFAPPRFRDEHLSDEVFFRLKRPDEAIRQHLRTYAAALDLAATASGNPKSIYLAKAQDALKAMSKWLREAQFTAFEVNHGGKSRPVQDWVKGVALRDRAHLGPDDVVNFRDLVNVVAGLALRQHFADLAPEYPSFSLLVTEANRKQLVGSALRWLAGGPRTKDAVAILDALGLLDGDRIDPRRSPYAQEVLGRLKAKGQGQVLNHAELLTGAYDGETFVPERFRLEPDLVAVVLGALVYGGHIVLALPGDKIDTGKLSQLADRSQDEIKGFKHIEAPKELNVEVLQALFELLGLAPGLAQLASQGAEEPVRAIQDAVTALVKRTLTAGTDLASRLAFWGQPLLREEELRDRRARLDGLKTFTEALAPYNTIGKLKNLRLGLEDIAPQKTNLEVLAACESLLALVAELGPTAAYLSQAEILLPGDHPWIARARTARAGLLERLTVGLASSQQGRVGQHRLEAGATLGGLKKDYVTAYIAAHTKARLGVTEDKTRTALRKDPRLAALRALAGIALMPVGQLTSFEERLAALKSCYQLTDTDLTAGPVCPHCGFKPANDSLPLGPAATALTQLDDDLDELLSAWEQTLLENLDDPIIQANFNLLKPADRQLIEAFLKDRRLPDPLSPAFIAAVGEALSGLEPVTVNQEAIRTALLAGGSPATPDELRKRFDGFISARCKGKDPSKLRFVVE